MGDIVSSSSCLRSPPRYPVPVQDVFLPYCQDVRHTSDTLFFYVEHDFRFHERDNRPPETWLPLVAGEDPVDTIVRPWERLPGAEPLARSGKGSAATAVPETARRGRFSDMRQSVRRSTADGGEDDVSEELCECIAYCNAAARHSLGDFVWLGWNGGHTAPGQRRRGPPTRICFGTQLLAMTPLVAALLEERLRARGPGHIDLKILECLAASPELRNCSSYVNPPVGGFSTHHASLNAPGTRPGPWNKPWCLGGTNEHNSTSWKTPERRCIARFQWDEPLVECSRVQLPDINGALLWRTQRPPRGPWQLDDMARRILTEWGWLDERGRWLGWAYTRGERWWADPEAKAGGRGRKGGKAPSIEEQLERMPENDYWRTLQVAPAGPPALGGVRRDDSPVSALGLELATACARIPQGHRHEQRAARDERQARAQYLQRKFTSVEQQAERACVAQCSVASRHVGELGRSPAEPLACGCVDRERKSRVRQAHVEISWARDMAVLPDTQTAPHD